MSWGGGSSTINEEYFEEYYRAKGFEIIAPEKLSLDEQLNLVVNADEVVTTLGSTSHFVVFMKPGSVLTILTRTDGQVLIPQCWLSQASGIKTTIVDVSMNFLPCNRIWGVNLLGPSECWKEYVKDAYGDDVENDTISDATNKKYLVEWINYYTERPYMSRRILENLDAFDFLNKMSMVFCGKLLSSKDYIAKTKWQQGRELNAAKDEIVELKNNYNKMQSDFNSQLNDLQLILKKHMAVEEGQKNEIESLGRANYDLKEKYYSIFNSLSFKVGRMITFIPRKVRDLFNIKKR